MATNPYFTQYHTQRFSFIGSPQQRDGSSTKDQRFINMYPELITSPVTDGKKYYLKKRPGTASFFTLPAGTSQGIFYWASNNTYYTGVGGILYQGTSTLIALSTTTGPIGFAEYRVGSQFVLFVCDGTKAWLIASNNVVTAITDVNFPAPHIPTPIFLDGYIFLATPGQKIINSKLNDPSTWPTDGFIEAEMFPDGIQILAKVQNYIAAIGFQSIEWFYDNANATGSPLQRNAPAVSQFGTPAPNTATQTERELILVGQTGNGGRTVWVLDGFQPTEIATAPVREALDLEGSSINLAFANTVQVSGHKFYILTLGSSSRTFVYDFEEKMWHEWTSGLGQAFFNYRYSADGGYGKPVFLGTSGGVVVNLDANVYTDLGAMINCQVITSKIDFDTVKRKRVYRLSLAADSPDGPTSLPMLVSWSDDDYNNFVPDVTLMIGSGYSTITQLGLMRRRAFRFTFQQNWPLRMESFELDIIQEVRR